MYCHKFFPLWVAKVIAKIILSTFGKGSSLFGTCLITFGYNFLWLH